MTSAEIAIEKGEAEVALEAAIPALEEAAEALNDLKKDDITEIRSFAKPHILVQKASPVTGPLAVYAAAVQPSCSKPAYGWELLRQGRMRDLMKAISICIPGEDEYCAGCLRFQTPYHDVQVCECVVILKNLKDVSWAGAKSMMADTGFLKGLVEFDKDSLSEKQVTL